MKKCIACGTELNDDARFCTACGREAEEVIEVAVDNTKKEESIGTVFTWGLLGLIFALNLPLLGLIFSVIAKNKANAFIVEYGELEGRASVGAGLAKAGFIVGLIGTILFGILIFVYGVLLAMLI